MEIAGCEVKSVTQNPMWNTAHQCTQLFQRNKIQHIQCRCNAYYSCMMVLIIINFVEYKCSQVVFSSSVLKASMVTEFSKILLGWQSHHMVYLKYLTHLSAQGDFVTCTFSVSYRTHDSEDTILWNFLTFSSHSFWSNVEAQILQGSSQV